MSHLNEEANRCLWTGKVNLTKEQLKSQFWRFDTDGDRRLSKQELNKAFNNLGLSFPAWRTWRALCHADENGDGYINEEEFNRLVVCCKMWLCHR
ncbi:hypothetical protein Patl1_08973 [Pistacia atlantica]|uniref:Uncharacterized protein n=1 Tax=Pistacia atlantica TaxID=434234 RepID=A0ACC1AGN9_9ROSI|nr:hypothetical protein Patl1_08973 [Pistacia atlantica]